MPLAARISLSSLAALCLYAGTASADEAVHRTAEAAPDNVVLANLFVMPFGVYNVEYERALGDRWAVTAGLTGFYANGTPFDASVRSRGFGGSLGARYYVTGAAPRGLFAAAFARAFRNSLESSEGMAEGPAAGVGAMVGYAHVFWRRLHVSAAAGAHVLWGEVAGTHLMQSGRAIDPEMRLALGVAF